MAGVMDFLKVDQRDSWKDGLRGFWMAGLNGFGCC